MKLGRLFVGLLIIPLAFLGSFSVARADVTISVSGNGSTSVNETKVEVQKEVKVEQKNEAQTSNDVKVDLNTGSNEANDNGGDITLQTGEVDAEVSIKNESNQSQVNLGTCGACNNEISVSLDSNGSGSQNSAALNSETRFQISVSNQAQINNSIKGSANTGFNTANNNQGKVRIITGDILVKEDISNTKVNLFHVSTQAGNTEVALSLNNNGSGSVNTLVANISDEQILKIAQKAELLNRSDWDLSTGHNGASGNLGDVEIKTGNILLGTSIVNDGINSGGVSTGTCCPPYDPGDDDDDENGGGVTPPVTPPTPGVINGNNKHHDSHHHDDESDDHAGSVLAAALGQILPATGGYWMFLATLANVLMLFMGVYLRLRGGHSPALSTLPVCL